jgi:glycosyltransferase involved in cell wall biosynthesis
MAQCPEFSVIIPAFNAEQSLGRALDSVLRQSLQDFEVIVVDDGSTDRTLDIANSASDDDPRIKVFHQDNSGCAAARNLACSKAAGEYLCLLDADDTYLPNYLSSQSDFISARPGFDIYSCNGIRVFPSGLEEPVFSGKPFDQIGSWGFAQQSEVNGIFGMAVVRKDIWQRVGGFRTDLRYAEDYDFWLRCLALGARHIYQPAVLGRYSESPSGKSRDRVPHSEAQIRIFEDIRDQPSASPEIRAACDSAIRRLRARIERLSLERRLEDGDFTHARGTYRRLRSAYLSGRLYWFGYIAMMISPALYVRLRARRNAARLGGAS